MLDPGLDVVVPVPLLGRPQEDQWAERRHARHVVVDAPTTIAFRPCSAKVKIRGNGVDIAHRRAAIRHRKNSSGEPLEEEAGAPRIETCGLPAYPRRDFFGIEHGEEPGEEFEVQALVLQTELEMPSEVVLGLVPGCPCPKFAPARFFALEPCPDPAPGEQRLHEPKLMQFCQSLKPDVDVGHHVKSARGSSILLEKPCIRRNPL